MTDPSTERCIAEYGAEDDGGGRRREAKRAYFVWFGYKFGEYWGDASEVVELSDDVRDAEGLRSLEQAVLRQHGVPPSTLGCQVVIRNFIRLEREEE